MSKVTTPIEQDGYNAYGYVDGKRVPVLSTSMGNCWDQDDQRAFCGHIVHCVNNFDRLVEVARRVVSIVHPHPSEDTERFREEIDLVDLARDLLNELERQS